MSAPTMPRPGRGDEAEVTSTLHVTHVITDLGRGGAEAVLVNVVAGTRAHGLSHSVVSLTDRGVYAAVLEAEGVPVTSLGMRSGVPDPRALSRLVRLLRRTRPGVIQSWMYHSDLLAGIAAALAGRIPVVWGIHQSDTDPATAKPVTRWTRHACARLSNVLPRRIVCCAESVGRSHAAIGYRSDRIVVIPNGFDLDRFVRDPQARARIRSELSIPDGAPVVGLVARFHPDKDHANFVAAAGLVARANPDAIFVLAGTGVEWSNDVMRAGIDALGLRARTRLLGPRSDVPSLLSAMDVLVLSSRTEGLPNVLGEAMACGVPCAATDCGDSRELIGPTGRIVPPRDPAALANATLDLLALAPTAHRALGDAAVRRVRERYDLRQMTRRYSELYRRVASGGERAARKAGAMEGPTSGARDPRRRREEASRSPSATE
jgi:glycosyltransferase involved in cell wall biosynthesis